MSLQNILLLATGIINLFMSIIIFSRGIRNKINLYFSLLTFFNFLWAVSLFVGRVLSHDIWYGGGAVLAYVAALGIAISLYYFSVHFPIKIKNSKVYIDYLIVAIFLFFSVVVYVKGFFILSYNKNLLATEYTLYFLKPVYILYSIYFIVIVLLAILNFFKKMSLLDNFLAKQVKILLISIMIGLAFGIYFDLILCYFGNFRYIWFGPIFTALMNAYVFYLINSNKDKISHG